MTTKKGIRRSVERESECCKEWGNVASGYFCVFGFLYVSVNMRVGLCSYFYRHLWIN